jgi:hypothetical protein
VLPKTLKRVIIDDLEKKEKLMSVLKKNKKSHLEKNMFLDEGVDIQRYDELKYPQLDKITEKQL